MNKAVKTHFCKCITVFKHFLVFICKEKDCLHLFFCLQFDLYNLLNLAKNEKKMKYRTKY